MSSYFNMQHASYSNQSSLSTNSMYFPLAIKSPLFLATDGPEFCCVITMTLLSALAYSRRIDRLSSVEPSSIQIISISCNVWLTKLSRHLCKNSCEL